MQGRHLLTPKTTQNLERNLLTPKTTQSLERDPLISNTTQNLGRGLRPLHYCFSPVLLKRVKIVRFARLRSDLAFYAVVDDARIWSWQHVNH